MFIKEGKLKGIVQYLTGSCTKYCNRRKGLLAEMKIDVTVTDNKVILLKKFLKRTHL